MRKSTKSWSFGAATALALGLAGSAQAGIITATYQGVITDGFDLTGVFAAPNTILTGDSFTAVYTINDSAAAWNGGQPPLSSRKNGGSYWGNQSPVSATITINGVTLSIPGSYIGDVYQSTLASGETEIYHNVEDSVHTPGFWDNVSITNEIWSYSHSIVSSYNYRDSLTYTLQTGDYNYGYFSDLEAIGHTIPIEAWAELDTTSITIVGPAVSGVPVPSTWTLLILGVGLIGFASRRRNAGLAVAT